MISVAFADQFETSAATNLLERALNTDDLDLAIGPIQTAIGITERDAGASAFAGLGQEGWRTLSPDHRRTWLAEWLRQEIWDVEI
jgi:hypothetical protein